MGRDPPSRRGRQALAPGDRRAPALLTPHGGRRPRHAATARHGADSTTEPPRSVSRPDKRPGSPTPEPLRYASLGGDALVALSRQRHHPAPLLMPVPTGAGTRLPGSLL